jgi:hypothetical protein
MESGGIGGFAPNWVAAPIKAKEYFVGDLPGTRLQKIEQHNPELPKASYQPVIAPAEGPVTYAERLGRESRQNMDEQIAANMAQAKQRVQAHHGSLHLIA